MAAAIPSQFLDLFQKKAFGNLATLMPDGTPQVTPVWVDYDGSRVILNSARGRRKDKNMEKWCERVDDHGEHVRHGPYVEIYEGGGKREYGRFRDGKRDGTWSRWHPSGKIDAITLWDYGKPVSFEAWHDSGQKWEQGSFVDGFKQGPWLRWHENGQKELEANYDHGTLERLYTMWHDNGQKEQQGEYKHGIREGLWVAWHRNGQKRQEILFHTGKPDDWYRAWHENGQQAEQALFHDGKPEGEYVLWHDNGQKEEEGSYHNGMIRPTRRRRDGLGSLIRCASCSNAIG